MITLTCEQLEERLAALHQASLQLVQEISLESLLQQIASLARDQVNARYAAVGVVDDRGKLQNFIHVGMEQGQGRGMKPPRGRGLIGALMKSEHPIRLARISSDPRHSGFPKAHPNMTSFLGVPIRYSGKHLGQIYLTDKLDLPEFTADDEQVIETLAAYAAIAISNARLYQEMTTRDKILTRRNENFALLNTLASTLATSSDTDQILNQALTQVMEYLKIEVGEIFLRQEDDRTLDLVLHRSDLMNHLWPRSHYRIGEGVIGLTALTGQPTLINLSTNNGTELSQAAQEVKLKQVACFPLIGRRGSLGVMSVATLNREDMDDLEIQFLSALSFWVGTAIENAQLNLQQTRLAVLEERERIGMDLHDGIIQSIYAVGLTLEHARLLMQADAGQARQRIDQAMSDLNNTIRDIRAYILDLRPRQFFDENLMDGIQRLANEFRANTLVDVNLQGSREETANLPNLQALAMFHICQEALANIGKHARAKHVDVVLWTTAERILLEVRDNGNGFDMNKVKFTLGHGLTNMQTRARNVGGDVDISSEPQAGTTVLAWVPITRG